MNVHLIRSLQWRSLPFSMAGSIWYLNKIIESINLLKACGLRNLTWPGLCLILRQIIGSINLPQICGSRIQTWLKFYLILRKMIWSINLPKTCGPRSQAWLRSCLILRKMIWSINLPKVCGPRSQTLPRFCLILKQIRSVTHNVINENMVQKTFINNNTFVGYLYSRGMVQHFHLGLSNNMHLF